MQPRHLLVKVLGQHVDLLAVLIVALGLGACDKTPLTQTGAADSAAVERWFEERGGALASTHEFDSHHDLKSLLPASSGLAIVPASAPQFSDVKRAQLEGLDVKRAVHVYAVAGRLRSPAAAAFLNLVRAADYSATA